ncbi:MAG TPA: hypothetical protein VFT29_04080 [Gemmatimonadaceae bacterium]|nr:hypothetical protein [Gemmatimonadaceae bacterium]
MPKSSSARRAGKSAARPDAVTYDEFKEFEGRKYTGMKIGRSHKWYYDKGEWKETKITPDLWQIAYAVKKRRAGKAPEGSGVPVGTEYHWYVVAHQNVYKLNANDYTTSLTGLKCKLAHKRAGSEKWSATPKTQRKHLIEFLRGVIADLEKERAESIATAAAAPTPRAKPSRALKAPPSMTRPSRRRSKRARARK